MTRFQIARDPIWRAPLLLIAATESTSYVDLGRDALDVRFGIAHLTIPYDDIREATPREWSWLLGIGIRIAGDKTLGLVGSTKGVVQIALHRPTVRGVLFMRHPRNIAISLEDPDGFLAALRDRVGMSAHAS